MSTTSSEGPYLSKTGMIPTLATHTRIQAPAAPHASR